MAGCRCLAGVVSLSHAVAAPRSRSAPAIITSRPRGDKRFARRDCPTSGRKIANVRRRTDEHRAAKVISPTPVCKLEIVNDSLHGSCSFVRRLNIWKCIGNDLDYRLPVQASPNIMRSRCVGVFFVLDHEYSAPHKTVITTCCMSS